jgi:hypothetical protein
MENFKNAIVDDIRRHSLHKSVAIVGESEPSDHFVKNTSTSGIVVLHKSNHHPIDDIDSETPLGYPILLGYVVQLYDISPKCYKVKVKPET